MINKQSLITNILFFSFVLLSFFIFTKLFGPIPFTVNSVNTNKNDLFTVTGEGKVSVVPDMAIINAGVVTSGSSVKQAQDALNQKINQVSEAVKKLGVDGKDIKTTSYSIYPSYNYNNGSQKITGYNASTNITVNIRDIDKANAVIDTATANGANQIDGVRFEVSDKVEAENKARQEAVKNAKEKAVNSAKLAGFSLGKLVSYSENDSSKFPQPIMARPMVGGEVSNDTKIDTGSNEISISVTLGYEIY